MNSKKYFATYYYVGQIFAYYWKLYGGWPALARSPYLHVACLLTVATYPLWWPTAPGVPAGPVGDPWFQATINIIPSMLGFTLGGYAILLAIGDEGFRYTISGDNERGKASPFIKVNSAFVHFVFIQTVALSYALICRAWKADSGVCAAFGCCLLFYAILCALAACFSVFRLARWFDHYAQAKRRKEEAEQVNSPPPSQRAATPAGVAAVPTEKPTTTTKDS